jgi:hypothetical protein
VIGLDLARDDRLAQAKAGVDHDLVTTPRERIGGEQHT